LQNSKFDQEQQESANQRELLQKDRDVREWMRLRDLYFADVCTPWEGTDRWTNLTVAFFYTKGKLPIFYANDLDHKAGPKNATTFQAWEPSHMVVSGDRARSLYRHEECRQQRKILLGDNSSRRNY
jgi:hypothetical protein